jgi:hypothetical protein
MASGSLIGILLEAEVSPSSQTRFQKRYLAATGVSVTPGSPPHYQSQSNKWGSELRMYFNDHAMAATLSALGLTVERGRNGYRSGEYRFRVNDNKLWWKLVETSGLRLGLN